MKEIAKEDLEKIRQTASRAAGNGAEPEAWREWRTLIQSLGVSSWDATRLLHSRNVLKWYCRFCFDEGLTEDGIDGYQRLLKGNARAQWIFEHEALRYLVAVRAAHGPTAVIKAFELFPRGNGPVFPDLQTLVASAESEIGDLDAALVRLQEVVRRHHDVGRYHSALARLEFEAGNLVQARRYVIAAARRGSIEIGGIDLGRLGLQPENVMHVAEVSRPPDLKPALNEFCQNPGLTLLPSHEPSPHVFGGGYFEMPSCPRCNRPITLIASVDATCEPTLTQFAERVPRLPIPHCRHCNLMFLEPDYQLAEDGRRIDVYNVKPSCGSIDDFEVSTPMHRQFAKLAEPERSKSSDLAEVVRLLENQRHLGPQFGGAPQWINDVRRCFCPLCDEEQVFYAAACETEDFETQVCLNPDGYIYYFVCLRCLIISTRVDNS